MKKNIKYTIAFTTLSLSLAFGFFVQANNDDISVQVKPVACTMEAKLCPDGVTSVGRVGPKCEFQACPGEEKREDVKNRFENYKKEMEASREKNKIKKEEFKDNKEGLKKEFEVQKEQQKNKIEAMIETVKNQREEYKKEFELKREEVKTKVEEMRIKFKEDLSKIKDEKKKLSSEKILDIIQDLNERLTSNLSEKIDKIENVLVSIESRISKAEEKGLDVTKAKAEAEKAKTAIETARKAVSAQSGKVYEVNVTTEVTLKADMKKLRDLFRADMKVVYEKIKFAHMAVKNTAEALAKVPRVDDDDGDNDDDNTTKEDSIKVETNSSASVNNNN